MHIHQIEIDNFKSFAEKTTIPFRQGFTTISGPNGSGKSNIIDSILFCLGLSSSRTMRAEKLTDLINNLSKRREASVTIRFRKPNALDGNQEALALTMSGDEDVSSEPVLDAEDMITVARRIKDGPNGYTSTYYLNGKVSTLTDIHEHLSSYNISPGCYNVMMQGDVAGIVNMSPMERRKIIDEIAGVAEFDRKIEQAQRELEATGANIERNTILLGEIEARLEQLSTERQHALKYQKLRDERQQYEGQVLAAKVLGMQKAIQATNQNIAEARKQKETSQTQLKILVDQIAQTRETLLQLSNEVKKKGEDQQIAIKKQIEGLKGHIARKEDSIRFLTQQVSDNAKNVEQMEAGIVRQQQNIEGIDAEIQGFEHQLKELLELFKTESVAYEKLNKQFDQLTESTGELSIQRAEIRQKLEAAEDELARLHREKMNLDAELKRFQLEKELQEKGQSEILEKESGLTERYQTLSQQVQELMDEKTVLEAQLKKCQLEYSQTRVAVNTAQSNFNQLNREYLQLEAQKRAYEEVHFGRAVEAVLRSGLEGVHGTLAQLGTVDPDYGLALEIALGGRIQNIVVDDDRVAQAAIEMLQRSKSGRATLLPLNKLQPARRLPVPPNGGGIVDFAVNLIEFDPQYEDVFAYALGDTLIVEDLASARRLLKQYRMVTLDGSLMEKSGAMTGGSAPAGGQGGGRFANSKKVDQEIQKLLGKLEETEKEKNRLEKQLNSLELKMDALKEQYGQCTNAHSRASIELEAITAQLEEVKTSRSSLLEHAGAEGQGQSLSKEITTLEAQMVQQEKAVQAQREALDQIENRLPMDKVEELRKAMGEVKFQRDYYDSQIRNVQAEIKGKTLEKNHQEQGIQHYRDRIQEIADQAVDIAKEQKAAQEEIQLTTVQIRELESQTTELDEELRKLQQERDAVQNQLIEQEKNKHIQDRQVTQLEEQIYAYQARKRELEPQLREIQAELEASGVDLASLEEATMPSEEELLKNIHRLQRQMEAMEPVNMLAIKEYDEVLVRQSELAEKIETLTRECESLNLRISGYQELKLASFMKAFENVDNHFKSIFAELSDGTGQLILTNPEEPFSGGLTIQAQPRGKKMQRLEAMSGGEKSLTSLAFVFSLQRYMPAPFYALDEVDMNLDGINAEKLANMVKRESQTAQFIVVSLRKPMIENSDRTVGVTQKLGGTSKVTGVKLRDDERTTAASA